MAWRGAGGIFVSALQQVGCRVDTLGSLLALRYLVPCSLDSRHACPRCDQLPAPDDGSARRLWLAFPIRHVRRKVERVLAQAGHWYETREQETMVVYASEGELRLVVERVCAALGDIERRDVTAVVTASDCAPGPQDLGRVVSLARLGSYRDAEWLSDLLRDGRLTTHFQPVFRLSDNDFFGHEALTRGVEPDGTLLPPTRLFDVARQAGLLFQLDLAARRTAVQRAHATGVTGALLVNFSPTSVYDPATCLRSTVAAVDAAGISHDRIVFELVESEEVRDAAHLQRILGFYRDAGFGVALDDVGSGYSSLNVLHRLRPDYLKLDMELVRDVHVDPFKAVIASKVLEIAQRLDIATIAEGVEREEELEWLRAHGATYAQGFLLGRPSPAPCRGARRVEA